MFFEDFISRSLIFAFLGLVFCAVFAISMMFRESMRSFEIHHLFGATHGKLYCNTLIPLLLAAGLGTFVGYLSAYTQLHLLHRSAYVRIAFKSGICHIVFVFLIVTFYFLSER